MNEQCNLIVFSNKAYNAIIDETFRKDPIETGGILLGHRLEGGVWLVTEVIPPGYGSVHQYAYFEPNKEFVDYLILSECSKYNIPLDLLGLWHRHPGSMDTFSGTDDNTNIEYAKLSPYGAISGLVNVDPKFRLTMRHVSNPLRYEIVEFEVGDDLIPDEYFKLRHFPEKGLNPSPSTQKKNDWTNTESMSELKSNSNKETTTIKTKRNNNLSLKVGILGVCALFFFILFLTLYSSQRIIKNDVNKTATLYELIYNSSDVKGLCLVDSIKVETTRKIADKEVVKTTYKSLYINPTDAVSIVKYSLLVLCVLSIGLMFVSLNQKKIQYSVLGSCVLAFLIVIVSPVNLSIAFFLYLVLISLILSYIVIGILKCFEVVNAYRNMPWYKRNKSLFFDEDQSIHKIEPNAERSFEEGTLVYTIITERHITRQEHTLAYQMIYSPNYLKDGSIKIYFIMPELDDMFTAENKLKSSFIKTDIDGDKYIEFGSETQKKMNGVETIMYLYKWIDSYNRHRAGDISTTFEKNIIL